MTFGKANLEDFHFIFLKKIKAVNLNQQKKSCQQPFLGDANNSIKLPVRWWLQIKGMNSQWKKQNTLEQ